mmetsp:Transcript_12717/g.14547  ORF Transcript_12717/g.14547 Transcript_12717/m.14547 type:complete len:113 (+) Transcript_12717:231-569(+)
MKVELGTWGDTEDPHIPLSRCGNTITRVKQNVVTITSKPFFNAAVMYVASMSENETRDEKMGSSVVRILRRRQDYCTTLGNQKLLTKLSTVRPSSKRNGCLLILMMPMGMAS